MSEAGGAARLFLAVPLTREARHDLADRLAGAPGGRLPGRPVPADNWHLTLRFLGDTPPRLAASLCAALEGAGLGPPFRVRLGGYGAFPRESRASILWLGVDEGTDELGRLARVLEDVARQVGFAPERRPFRPHLTLSRIPQPQDLRPTLAALPPFQASMPVSEVILFRSELGHGPARYEPVGRWALR